MSENAPSADADPRLSENDEKVLEGVDEDAVARDLIPAVPAKDVRYQPIPRTCAACGNGPWARDCQFCGGSGFAP